MVLFILAYLAGVLTIVSPCILPVLPFVFARAGQPFLRSTLPMMAGMAVTFAGVATLAAAGGGWAVELNEYGRYAAMLMLAFFGLALMVPAFADRMTRPLVRLGAHFAETAGRRSRNGATIGASLLLGVATGLLWAPCAGPVLGLILASAALNGANLGTTALLAAYALGAATSLMASLIVGGRVYEMMKRSLGLGEWLRRGAGAAVLVAVVAIFFGLDTRLLTSVPSQNTDAVEQELIERLRPRTPVAARSESAVAPSVLAAAQGNRDTGRFPDGAVLTRAVATAEDAAFMTVAAADSALPVEGIAPQLDGAVDWLNSKPLTMAELKGKVVLVAFWTYTCINCQHVIPYVRAWAEKYKDKGLVVIGVHSPEFAFEKKIENVRKATKDLNLTYPIAIDNNFAIWKSFNNNYWPAHYFIDTRGRIRYHHFGEHDYEGSERAIQQLLIEAGAKNVPTDLVSP